MKSLFYTLLIIFCPFAFAENGEEILTIIFSIVIVIFYIIFVTFILVMFFKKWNQTNKLLEKINETLKNKQ